MCFVERFMASHPMQHNFGSFPSFYLFNTATKPISCLQTIEIFFSICVSFYVFHQVVDARACMHTWLFFYSILDILFMLLKHELKFWNCKKRLKMRKVFTKLEKAIFKSKCSAAKNVSQFQQRRVFILSLSVVFTNFIFSLYLFALLLVGPLFIW